EIDSMPTPLDERMRRIRQLEIEREGIRRDKDAQSEERLEKIERELVQLRKETDALTMQWQGEKDAIKKMREMKEKMEQARREAGCGSGPSGRTRRSWRCRPRSGGRGPASRIPNGRWGPSSFWGPRAWGRPSWRGRWPSSCSTTSRRWSGSTCRSIWRSTRSRG